MAQSPSFLGTGWSFPPSFTKNGADVQMVSGAEDVHQSLQILFATRLGERVMREDYGCALSDYMFEEVDQGLLNNLSSVIEKAITRHERRIILDSVTVNPNNDINGILMIHISYTIRTTNSRYNMVYPFYVNEGVNPGESL